MVILTAHNTIRAEALEAVVQDYAEMMRLVRENEPGCILYQVHSNQDSSADFMVYEVYRDQAAFETHIKTPYFQDIVVNRIRPHVISQHRTFWEAHEPSAYE